jgi:hypothetical protein
MPYKDKLLKDLDETALLVKDWVTEQFGEEFTLIAGTNIRKEYEMLIPDIPYILG